MTDNDFNYFSEQFADIRILRYRVPGFEQLSLRRKLLIYHLHKAALAGRDILYDQNYKHNLQIRAALEHIYRHYQGPKNTCFELFGVYLKRFWFSNGIHHHYSNDKMLPDFDLRCFKSLIEQSPWDDFSFGELKDSEGLYRFFEEVVFNPAFDAKKVNLHVEEDIVATSAVNFYEGVTRQEVDDFYAALGGADEEEPPAYGLNSKVVKIDGKVKELVWKKDGLYDSCIRNIIKHLRAALPYTENELQQQAFLKLIAYYESGNLRIFDEYNKLWVQDQSSFVDAINGFIEVYNDPLGRKATFESTVFFVDEEGTKRASLISDNAAWFEQHSTTDAAFKKEQVQGVSARAVFAAFEAGDCAPSTPIGINLPNAEWIRTRYGSKSVSISNIIHAYDVVARQGAALEEFAYDDTEVALAREWGDLGSILHVDMHEIVGHGSGKLAPGVADPAVTLKSYASTIEEARADLVALYFAIDPHLVELGLMPSLHAGYAEYNSYIRSALLVQLVRIKPGDDLEESHMRNRQLIAQWAYTLGRRMKVIEKVKKDNKTYFKINDYQKLREIFGIQLRTIQRIKSEGDYAMARELVEKYGVKVDKNLHAEVLERWKKLNIAPYSGFINPEYRLIKQGDEVQDVQVYYPDDFAAQMLRFSQM